MGGSGIRSSTASGGCGRRGLGVRLLVLAATVVLVLTPTHRAVRADAEAPLIGGPYARLLAHSADLGVASGGNVQLVVALRDSTRPQALMRWADHRGLSVRWRPGEDWAIVEGGADKVADAFAVAVHNYRIGEGHVFYAAARQPRVPPQLRAQVTDVGRILGYGRRTVAKPPSLP